MTLLPRSYLLVMVLLLNGCGSWLKSHEDPPRLNYPPQWPNDTPPSDSNLPFSWQDFADPKLRRWLQRVMANNNDVALAVLRLYQAQLTAEKTAAGQAPGLKATLSGSQRRALSTADSWSQTGTTNLSTSYELDLWGKLARQREVADWEKQASEQDLMSARLLLLASASKNYWQLGFINQQRIVARQRIENAERTLKLVDSRYQAGKVGFLDKVTAEKNLLEQKKNYLQVQNERRRLLNQQSLLLGAPPGSDVEDPTPLSQSRLPGIRAGISVKVLHNRPDVRAKEYRLRKALNEMDSKRLEYYPSFSLTGQLGTSSATLVKLLSQPLATLGASLSLPFLEWRTMGINNQLARNNYQQQAIEFTQVLYKAMADVDNALTQRSELMARQQQLQALLTLARKAERLTEIRYRQGKIALNFLLDAQEQRLSAELAIEENLLKQYENLAQIYLELGGETRQI